MFERKKNNLSLVSCKFNQSIYLYPYFVNVQQVKAVIDTLGLPLLITQDAINADVILALRSSVKKNNRLRQIAKSRKITVYTIYSSSIPHITRALRKVLNLNLLFSSQNLNLYDGKSKYIIDILEETREAIEKIVLGHQQMVELSSSVASLRKLQYLLVKLYNVRSRSFGEEPHRRLRIFP